MKRIIFLSIFVFSCMNVNFGNSSKSCPSTWNIIFYIAADNDLNKHGFNTVQTSAEGYLKNPNINVFFMCDGISTENFNYKVKNEASYYKLEKGSLVKLEHKGVIDSGSLSSFTSFIDFISDNYGNADHTALFLWGHGSNIALLEHRQDNQAFPKRFARDNQGIFLGDFNPSKFDRNYKQGLSFNELIEALKYVSNKLKDKKIDILGLDACTLMKVEIAYEIKDYVHYLVASQIKQNALSWNYKDVLNYLSKNLSITPLELVNKIILSYRYFYEFEIYNSHYNTQELKNNRRNDAISALDLTAMERFHAAFENYIEYLIKFLKKCPSELKEQFISDFRGKFINSFTQWEYGNILKGSIIIEFIVQEEIDKILNGEVVKQNFSNHLNFLDLKGMMKLIYQWFIQKASTELDNFSFFHNKAYEEFKRLVILNYNREKKENLKGLSIRYTYRTNEEYVKYLFGNKQWTTFLKLVNDIPLNE